MKLWDKKFTQTAQSHTNETIDYNDVRTFLDFWDIEWDLHKKIYITNLSQWLAQVRRI